MPNFKHTSSKYGITPEQAEHLYKDGLLSSTYENLCEVKCFYNSVMTMYEQKKLAVMHTMNCFKISQRQVYKALQNDCTNSCN